MIVIWRWIMTLSGSWQFCEIHSPKKTPTQVSRAIPHSKERTFNPPTSRIVPYFCFHGHIRQPVRLNLSLFSVQLRSSVFPPPAVIRHTRTNTFFLGWKLFYSHAKTQLMRLSLHNIILHLSFTWDVWIIRERGGALGVWLTASNKPSFGFSLWAARLKTVNSTGMFSWTSGQFVFPGCLWCVFAPLLCAGVKTEHFAQAIITSYLHAPGILNIFDFTI